VIVGLTVTVQLADTLLPSLAVTVTVAVPSLIPLIVPFVTVTTDVLLLFQVTFLFSALLGVIVGDSVLLSPIDTVCVLGMLIPVTFTVE
jgi:hypothetical protein